MNAWLLVSASGCMLRAWMMGLPVSRKAMTCRKHAWRFVKLHTTTCSTHWHQSVHLGLRQCGCACAEQHRVSHSLDKHPGTGLPDAFSAAWLQLLCHRLPCFHARRCHARWCMVPEHAEELLCGSVSLGSQVCTITVGAETDTMASRPRC